MTDRKVQLDATKTGFPIGLIDSFGGKFEAFKAWYDPKYKGVSADKVWKDLETKKKFEVDRLAKKKK
jgi:hypothetical protein